MSDEESKPHNYRLCHMATLPYSFMSMSVPVIVPRFFNGRAGVIAPARARNRDFTGERIVINNTSLNKWTRLAKKQLDQQFKQRMMEGLNCSLFEATAVVNVVHDIYDTYLEASTEVKPGQMRLTIISAEAPPNKSLDQSQQVTAVLTMYDEQKDLQVKKEGGTVALRRHRIRRLCREAYQQGGLLTVEDLANRLLNCGERTISRDLKALREEGIVPPLRSTVKDMGGASPTGNLS
jgi:hypothetical protein